MGYKNDYDIEGHSPPPNSSPDEKAEAVPVFYTDQTSGVPGESFEIGDSLYAKIQRAVGRFGVEQRGIERVPEDERTDTNLRKVGTMWLAANVSDVPIDSIWMHLGNAVVQLGGADYPRSDP